MPYSRDPIYDPNRPGSSISRYGYSGTQNMYNPEMQRYERNSDTRLPVGGSQPSLTPKGNEGFGLVNPLSGTDDIQARLNLPGPAPKAGPGRGDKDLPVYTRKGRGTPGFQGERNFEEMYGDTAEFPRQPPSGPDSTDYNGLTVSDTVPQGALGITPPDAISTGVVKAKEIQQDEISPSNLGVEGPAFRELNDKRIIKKLMEIMNKEV